MGRQGTFSSMNERKVKQNRTVHFALMWRESITTKVWKFLLYVRTFITFCPIPSPFIILKQKGHKNSLYLQGLVLHKRMSCRSSCELSRKTFFLPPKWDGIGQKKNRGGGNPWEQNSEWMNRTCLINWKKKNLSFYRAIQSLLPRHNSRYWINVADTKSHKIVYFCIVNKKTVWWVILFLWILYFLPFSYQCPSFPLSISFLFLF